MAPDCWTANLLSSPLPSHAHLCPVPSCTLHRGLSSALKSMRVGVLGCLRLVSLPAVWGTVGFTPRWFVIHSFCPPRPLGWWWHGGGRHWVVHSKAISKESPLKACLQGVGSVPGKATRYELPGPGGGIGPKDWLWLRSDHLAGAVVLASEPQPRQPIAQQGVAKTAGTLASLHSRPLNSCHWHPWAKPTGRWRPSPPCLLERGAGWRGGCTCGGHRTVPMHAAGPRH